MFGDLRTPRLLVRSLRPQDAQALHSWRNEPAVVRYQAWVPPVSLEEAEQRVRSAIELGGPVNDQWWTAAIEHRGSGEALGELVVHLTNGERSAEVGYSMASRAWGYGYATEALAALVDWLFRTFPLTRVSGSLHPDNTASAMVLERTGLLFEGHHRLSFWLGDDNSDDWVYGMTREQWLEWTERPAEAPASVRLVPISSDNRDAVRALRTHHSQQRFVAPVERSFGDALFPDVVDGAPVVPWLRAIEADGQLVGFAMLALASDTHPDPYLWRLLIDRLHQRRSVGSRALELVIAECRSWGARALVVNWAKGKGSPRPFYLDRGFVPTGRFDDSGETEARLTLPDRESDDPPGP